MSTWNRIQAIALLLVLPGCFLDSDDDDDRRRFERVPRGGVGTLIVDWTIDGAKDPFDCADRDAVTLAVTIETLRGAFVGDYEQDCEAFATSIDLSRDDYVGSAVLLDPDGYERTTAVDMGRFSIFRDDVSIPIDFPADSFF